MSQRTGSSGSWFTSSRERRLWSLALLVVAAIFLTLGIAPALADVLRDRELLDAAFGLGMLLVGAMIMAIAARARPSGVEVGVVLGISAVLILVIARAALPPEERTHLIEYAVLAVLIYEALAERASHARRVPVPAISAIVLTTSIGVLDELVQAILPRRVFDVRDILFNAAAVVIAVVASRLLGRARQR